MGNLKEDIFPNHKISDLKVKGGGIKITKISSKITNTLSSLTSNNRCHLNYG